MDRLTTKPIPIRVRGPALQPVGKFRSALRNFKFAAVAKSSLFRIFLFAPFENGSTGAQEHTAGKYAHPPGMEPKYGESIACRTLPGCYDARVVTDRWRRIQKEIPYHRSRVIVEGPTRTTFRHT